MAVKVAKLGFNCRDCNEHKQVFRGCNGNPRQKLDWSPDICPVKQIDRNINVYFELYGHYKDGYLPYPGTIMQQPSKLLSIFNIIDSEKNKLNRKS